MDKSTVNPQETHKKCSIKSLISLSSFVDRCILNAKEVIDAGEQSEEVAVSEQLTILKEQIKEIMEGSENSLIKVASAEMA